MCGKYEIVSIFAHHLKGVLLEKRNTRYELRNIVSSLVAQNSNFKKAEIIPKEPGQVMLPREIIGTPCNIA